MEKVGEQGEELTKNWISWERKSFSGEIRVIHIFIRVSFDEM